MAQSTVTPATPARELAPSSDPFVRLRQQAEDLVRQLLHGPVTPWTTYTFEQQLQAAFTAAARTCLEQALGGLESQDPSQAAPKVRYQGQTYRRNKRTKAQVATSFGTVTLWSWLYLAAEDGEPGLHPLHVRLGLAGGATPLLAERVARQAVDFSQQEVRQWLLSEHGLRWSNDRLRRLLREFRCSAVAFRAPAQEQRLLQWLAQAEHSRGRHRPVLAVGRDGVMVPLRGSGYQEASAATASVYDRRGRRLGTVYLGQMPEAHQATLSDDLTALVEAAAKKAKPSS